MLFGMEFKLLFTIVLHVIVYTFDKWQSDYVTRSILYVNDDVY